MNKIFSSYSTTAWILQNKTKQQQKITPTTPTLSTRNDCRFYIGISEEKVCVHRHRLCKHLVMLSAYLVGWFRIQIVQACALASAENEFI